MSKESAAEYKAVVTISWPESPNPSHFQITLYPEDTITLPEGKVIPLQDCTMTELAHFADSVEQLVREKMESKTLLDLILEGEAEVQVVIDTIVDEATGSSPIWLDYMVAIPVTQSIEVKSKEHEPAREDLHQDGEQAPIPEVDDTISEDSKMDRIVKQDPLITVAQSESIFEDKASHDQEVATAEKPAIEEVELRILGKRRPLNHPTWTAVDILVNEPAFRNTQAHATSSPNREVAGVLIGPPPQKQPDGRYVVHVSDAFVAKHTRMQGASVTYTPESWRYVNDRLQELYPNDSAVIVGWYHSHPGFGIFLSGMDQFIHQNFFIQIWHIALVLDPVASKSGFFCWNRKKDHVSEYEFPWPKWAKHSW